MSELHKYFMYRMLRNKLLDTYVSQKEKLKKHRNKLSIDKISQGFQNL